MYAKKGFWKVLEFIVNYQLLDSFCYSDYLPAVLVIWVMFGLF